MSIARVASSLPLQRSGMWDMKLIGYKIYQVRLTSIHLACYHYLQVIRIVGKKNDQKTKPKLC